MLNPTVNLFIKTTKEEFMLKRNGFILIEFLIAVIFVGVLVIIGIFLVLYCGNFWYSEEDILRGIKIDHPAVTEILNIKLGVIDKSIITVKENGVNHDYCLDTSILRDHEFSECQK